ncbi:aspartate carbamoyltransferase [Candidatus Roizmanbacteria bacterium CG_4_9_14_3_um_filter_33_18]|uniref:Aspartate carbamoyltransferase n=3 Tax=Candidatus Roizmaniibacteriota TaxID=1752723 RepID=A0A2M7U8U9_9BACT|nr:MAG: aspartate carbamoyltransferase [Candidatus Roizmanbacteria bacterium CG22_combo_CG10-13_8_21_14_all_34_12]PIZ67589.1 MAG: aspartate carbamoyltransferase [Candidatus Roizmanbacteria bacterium CG_4_10_14_0_2_um_filter_33_96]PJA55863.1 MAG: aspartate carbamoyltransferase [Candidatus Roizmanbacteria bacterium CG_4_9_14_3_um_filter_33_18]
MKNSEIFFGKDIISLDQFNRKSVEKVFATAAKIKKTPTKKLLKILPGKIVGLMFFEPSTRTFSSNSAAVKRLGGQTVEYQNPLSTSSVVKGETIEDTTKMMEQYCDAIVMRHPIVGTLKKVAEVADVPVINAGDGIGEHPTQALLDMFTVFEKFKHIDNIKGLIVGDLLNGRTVHSIIKCLSIFPNNTLYLLSPKQLRLSNKDLEEAKKRKIKLIEIKSFEEIPADCHFWYWTRVQKERFTDKQEYEKLKLNFILTKKLVDKKAGKNTLIMHPLPRVGEVETEVDNDPRAVYLTTEAKNGMYVRMALFSLILEDRK